LEHQWVTFPRGPVKRFLQGIIQVSVGLYHARREHTGHNQLRVRQAGGWRDRDGIGLRQFVGSGHLPPATPARGLTTWDACAWRRCRIFADGLRRPPLARGASGP
jgi:hypothetical protein